MSLSQATKPPKGHGKTTLATYPLTSNPIPVDFETAWRVFLARRTEADFQAWRDERSWHARKTLCGNEARSCPPLPRATKITFAEMRESGVRGLLAYCSD
jgi:hypothetical protein